MKTYLQLLIILLCTNVNTLFSQDTLLTSKDSVTVSAWKLGLGFSIIDDSAKPIKDDLFNIKETWNAVPYPNRISLGRLFNHGLGLELSGTYNRYKVGKLVDGQINTELRNYFAVDGLLAYHLNQLIGNTGWFDPYLQTGAGYSSIGSIGRTTFNAGFGFNIWTSNKLGINLNTMGKWGIPKGSTKQLQHSIGVLYQWGAERKLTKKGLEKKLLLEAMEKEAQRVQDSINSANLAAANAQLLAEKLQKEQDEAKRLAALEDEKRAENTKRENIESKLKAIGSVYFDLNSSYLNAPSRVNLDKMVLFLTEHPDLVLKVTSHTDSRGEDDYNLWLSERRLKRTVDYLVAKGVPRKRLDGTAKGERELSNECDNATPCSEEKHKVNRRSMFNIVRY